jgi:hypothetical protein
MVCNPIEAGGLQAERNRRKEYLTFLQKLFDISHRAVLANTHDSDARGSVFDAHVPLFLEGMG